MLSRKSQTKDEQRQLFLLISGAGGFLLLLFLTILAAKTAAGNPALVRQVEQGLARTIPPAMQAPVVDQAAAMGIPLEAGSQAYWYLARAGGVIAYLLLWLATCWGIMMSSKVLKGYMNFARAYSLHEFLPMLGVVFAAIHALVLLGDTYIGFSVQQLLIPFSSSYKPLWTGLGSLAFYMFLALIFSSYLRKRIGQRSWRAFHYTSYLAFLLVLVHGLMAGSDSGSLGMRALYSATGGISLFLVFYRMLAHAPKQARERAGRPSNSGQ
jgi:sulfoxide reductase heme-binding subunit YedZ